MVEIEAIGRPIEPEGEDDTVADRVGTEVDGSLGQTQFSGEESRGEPADWIEGVAEEQAAAFIGSKGVDRHHLHGEAQGVRSEVKQLPFRLEAEAEVAVGLSAAGQAEHGNQEQEGSAYGTHG